MTADSGQGISFRPETEFFYRTHITALLVHIRQHLDEPMQLADLVKIAGFSPFHLHHLFTVFVGVPMAEYIRRLRLGRAAKKLLERSPSVTQIALEAGYDSPAAFSKAFRRAFGASPILSRSIWMTRAKYVRRIYVRRSISRSTKKPGGKRFCNYFMGLEK